MRALKARGGPPATGPNDSGMSDSKTTASLVTTVLEAVPSGLTLGIQVHGFTDEVQIDRLTPCTGTC
ncbi:hypothetical protein JF66_15760 [Cryobacterium sp. MLB-32]|uniref:hypothetical protein n=1 Tax=Cryobacterium sp. MLB-32 TaxID=1529318 RepID=UPI0004E734AB|nr:hypothetical protein [Cryobacterium sp. MLB-32]KFF58807.1 hypothetical protein JF66_15760 [Cryobacterium sp. MLB-32]